MKDKPLPEPMTFELPDSVEKVNTLQEAISLLTDKWPEEARGPRHRDALDTCLKVIDGHRSMADAVATLRDAAAEAGKQSPG